MFLESHIAAEFYAKLKTLRAFPYAIAFTEFGFPLSYIVTKSLDTSLYAADDI